MARIFELFKDTYRLFRGKPGPFDGSHGQLFLPACSGENGNHAMSLFLGPKAENHGLLRRLLDMIVSKHCEGRNASLPCDIPFHVTKDTVIQEKLERFLDDLNKWSIPFGSPRYHAHVSFDACLPSVLGYFATMLNNPNNVAFEGGPFTTQIEMLVGKQICEMVGYDVNDSSSSAWGHIPCDGTVANIESIWAARNLKFYPLSLQEAMLPGNGLDYLRDTFTIETCQGVTRLFGACSVWELLNLKVSTILEIPERLFNDHKISASSLESVLSRHLIQTIGKDVLMWKYGLKRQPIVIAPSSRHYSWPRGAALTGIGSENLINVNVDAEGRMDIGRLRDLLIDCAKKQIAVYQVVAVMGTTAQGAVDPLNDVIRLRDELSAYGLSFTVHADAALGGYFATMLPLDCPVGGQRVALKTYTSKHLRALRWTDSVTIDPHKAGYICYPAGGLCYKDGRMRFLLTWTAPYIDRGDTGMSISIFGVEGSKAGAAAAAVYLAHDVIGLGPDGYGLFLGGALHTCRRFAAYWATMSEDALPYIVVPLSRLPSERRPLASGEGEDENVEAEKRFIRERILKVDSADDHRLVKDAEAMALLQEIGPDLNVNVFACNFRKADGSLNRDVRAANQLNQHIYERLSVSAPGQDPMEVPFYLSCSTLKENDYEACLRNFKGRLGLSTKDDHGESDLLVLRNVVMSPFPIPGKVIKNLVYTFRRVLMEEVEKMRECV